jgi:hypothetical protein
VRSGGDWADRGAPQDGRRPPREWKLERPVVSSYWPAKGKAGTRIVIRGRNFPADAQVLFAGTAVTGANVKDDRITFAIPANAASGDIALRAGRGRPVAVGTFEVEASYDAAAEAKRLEDERRRAAEAAWAKRRAELANDRRSRETAIAQRREERERTREQRREQRLAELQAKWARAFLADEETQAELTLHAQRVAELERMLEIAQIKADAKLAVRIEMTRAREDARHTRRMAALQASFGKGGTP